MTDLMSIFELARNEARVFGRLRHWIDSSKLRGRMEKLSGNGNHIGPR
jgi:hypothetical protein